MVVRRPLMYYIRSWTASTKVIQMSLKKAAKKKMGRPTTVGASTMLTLRLPPTLIEAIDAHATAMEASRSEAARRLIELGLQAKAKGKVTQ